ncbi:hypothetical protein GCM10009608_52660 [Pseudonocardia alaniniphila]
MPEDDVELVVVAILVVAQYRAHQTPADDVDEAADRADAARLGDDVFHAVAADDVGRHGDPADLLRHGLHRLDPPSHADDRGARLCQRVAALAADPGARAQHHDDTAVQPQLVRVVGHRIGAAHRFGPR